MLTSSMASGEPQVSHLYLSMGAQASLANHFGCFIALVDFASLFDNERASGYIIIFCSQLVDLIPLDWLTKRLFC